MQEIKCPKCGEVFQVDEQGYAAIVKQVRDVEFTKELQEREKRFDIEKESAVELAKSKTEADFLKKIGDKEAEITRLKAELEAKDQARNMAVSQVELKKEKEIIELKNSLDRKTAEEELSRQALIREHEAQLKQKDEAIAFYKDLKAKMSTKMVGETLEQHCRIEFNKIRATAFQHAYFDKDNDASDGTKGDFIFRDYDENGLEYISIMFEMKNEMDETAAKHTNESFFKKLDSDRKKKNCEYAVLVSLLEADNELYNQGIVDVSYQYEKMYVIRPQFFIPIITLLKNAALKSLEYKQELELIRSQSMDVSNFENKLIDFQTGFNKNCESALTHYSKAIDQIDDTIKKLQKIKDELTTSGNQLRLANNKAMDLSVKKLTRGNPTMQKMFEEANAEK